MSTHTTAQRSKMPARSGVPSVLSQSPTEATKLSTVLACPCICDCMPCSSAMCSSSVPRISSGVEMVTLLLSAVAALRSPASKSPAMSARTTNSSFALDQLTSIFLSCEAILDSLLAWSTMYSTSCT